MLTPREASNFEQNSQSKRMKKEKELQSFTKTYPIYSFNARWSQVGVQDPNFPNSYKGLPEGRIWNATGFKKMFRTEQTQDELDKIVREWWENYVQSELDYANRKKEPLVNFDIQDLVLEAKFKEHNTFICTWFGHETFDDGQSDEEFLQSFEEFVRKYEHQQEIRYDTSDPDYHCLMGAEDRWRWRSGNEEYEGIPCRCEGCKKAGMLRIAH